jgi:dTDP-4-dehydrorhamnose reductase
VVAPIEAKLTWIIFGSESQLGRQLSSELLKRQIIHKCIPRVEADVRKLEEIRSTLSEGAQVVVNCAAWTDVRGAESNWKSAFEVNEIGAGNLALAASELGCLFLHISTDYVFSGEKTSPYSEEDKANPLNVYGESKLAGEKRVFDLYGTRSLIVRTSWLYSPWGHNFVKTMIRRALKELKTEVVNDQLGSPTNAKDLAKTIVLMVEKNIPSGLYHCSGSGQTTWFKFAETIFHLTGKPESLLVPINSENLKDDLQRPKYTVLDNSKVTRNVLTSMPDWTVSLERDFSLILQEVEKETH